MQCPMALQRLVVVGLPATVEHGGSRSAPSSSAAVVAEITAAFITCLDSVRLNMLAVDQVLAPSPHHRRVDTMSCRS
jgi:ESCRT-I complex subunit VPS28